MENREDRYIEIKGNKLVLIESLDQVIDDILVLTFTSDLSLAELDSMFKDPALLETIQVLGDGEHKIYVNYIDYRGFEASKNGDNMRYIVRLGQSANTASVQSDEIQTLLDMFSISSDDTSKNSQELKLQQMMIEEQKQTFLTNLSDEQAKEIPLVYPSWADYEDGYLFEVGTRVNYNGGLWKCATAHKKQSDWYPSASPTLWIELDKKESTGTKEDPIEVPTSASTSGFEYIKGKYYKEGTSLYLMNRQGMNDGDSVTLYYMPSQLVGHYFEEVS